MRVTTAEWLVVIVGSSSIVDPFLVANFVSSDYPGLTCAPLQGELLTEVDIFNLLV